MEEILTRFWTDLVSRPSGPLNLRFLLQPAMAVFFGFRAGMRDAQGGALPFLKAFLLDKDDRRNLMNDGWKDIGKLLVMAVVLDSAFQIFVFRWLYPVETLVIAFVLAVFPYVLVRGAVNRISGHFFGNGVG